MYFKSVFYILFSYYAYILNACTTEYCKYYDVEHFILRIQSVDNGIFENKHVKSYSRTKTLLADDANVWQIGPQAFRNLRNVTTISLSNNRLRVLKDYMFDGCVNLKIVFLSGNEIRKISSHFLRTQNEIDQFHLTDISLADNRIRSLDLTVFEKCCFKSLKQLDVSENYRLDVYPRRLFTEFKVLNWSNFGYGFLEWNDYNSTNLEDQLIDNVISLFQNRTTKKVVKNGDDDVVSQTI